MGLWGLWKGMRSREPHNYLATLERCAPRRNNIFERAEKLYCDFTIDCLSISPQESLPVRRNRRSRTQAVPVSAHGDHGKCMLLPPPPNVPGGIGRVASAGCPPPPNPGYAVERCLCVALLCVPRSLVDCFRLC